jgi:uncharacterized membrane protein
MESGFLIILIGIILILIGSILLIFQSKSKKEFAISVFIGPFPIIIGTEKAILISLLIISLILLILFLE